MNSVATTDRPEPVNRTAAEAARARAEAGYARRDRERFTIEEKLEDARLDARAVRAGAARASNRPVAGEVRGQSSTREVPAQDPSDQSAAARGASSAATGREAPAAADGPARPRHDAAPVKARGADGGRAPASETTEDLPAADVPEGTTLDRATGAMAQPAAVASSAKASQSEATGKGEASAEGERTKTAEVVVTPPGPIPAAPPPTAAPPEAVTGAGPARPSTGEAAKVAAASAALGEGPARTAQAGEAGGAKASADTAGGAAAAPEPGTFASLVAVPPPTRAAAPAVREAVRSGAGAAEAGVSPATPMRAVPIEIGLRALDGTSSFDIRLDPVELGRIDVRLDIDQDSKQVKAHLTVDRVETLQLLQRDAGLLEQAFVQAGLTPSPDGLGLSLRDAGGDRSGTGQDGDERRGGRPGRTSSQTDEAAPAARLTVRARTGLDIRI